MPRFKIEVPAGAFAPDDKERDTPQFEDANNLLPVFGSYRTIPALRAISSVSSSYPVTGSLAHLVTSSAAVQDGQPSAFFLVDDAGVEVGDWTKSDISKGVWELLQSVSDASNLTARGALNSGSPVWLGAEIGDLQDPGKDDGFSVIVRYRLFDIDNLDSFSWEIQCRLRSRDGAQTYNIPGLGPPITEYHGQDGYGTSEILIPDTVIQQIRTDGNFENLALEIQPIWVVLSAVAPPTIKPLLETFSEGLWTLYDTETTDTFIDILAKDADPAVFDENHLLIEEHVGEVKYFVQLDEVSYKLDVASGYELNVWLAKEDVGKPDIDLDISLHKSDGTQIATVTHTAIADIAPVKKVLTFQQSEWDELDSGLGLEARVTTRPTGGAQGQTTTKVTVDADGQNVDFLTGFGCGNDKYQCVNQTEPDEAAYVYEGEPGNGAFAYYFKFPNLPAGTDPADLKAYVHCRAFTNAGRVEVRLEDGSSNTAPTKSASLFGQAVTVTCNGAAGLDINDLEIRIRRLDHNSAEPWQLYIYSVWLELPASDPTGTRLYRINLTEPVSAGMGVSHMRVEGPIPGDISPGDEPRVYAGTEESIYDISEAGWVDVSKTESRSYNDNAPYPRPAGSWVFASWGDQVIATDGANPIQIQKGFGDRFEDLLDNAVNGTEEPLARYLAVVKDQLVIGNILLPTDLVNFKEYTLWYSRVNDPTNFRILDLTGQSDYQNLVATPGEITWIQGGEYGTVYKRNSIYRMNYIGPPFMYEIVVVADNEGTAHGRSVVKVGDDQFFFGGGGFRVLPFGGKPQPLGDGVVTRMFIDAVYEDRAMAQIYSTDRRESEAAVFGRYDPWSGCIYWVYRRLVDDAYMNIFGVIFNPKENRWAPMTLNKSLCELTVLPNFPQTYPGLMRSIVGYNYEEINSSVPARATHRLTTENFSGSSTLVARVETKVLSTKFFAGQEGIHKNCTIHGFRPKATVLPAVEKEEAADPIDYLIRVAGAEDPTMRCRYVDTEWIQYIKNANKDGWLMFGNPVNGEYFKIEMLIPELHADSLRDLEGYELDVEVGESD